MDEYSMYLCPKCQKVFKVKGNRAAGKNNLGICDEVWHSMIRSDREKK